MAESEVELKSLLMKVKVEGEKVGLKLNIQKTKIMASGPRRPGFDPWVGKILWRREWLPTPEFLPGESHGQSVDREAWWATVRGVAESQTHLSD